MTTRTPSPQGREVDEPNGFRLADWWAIGRRVIIGIGRDRLSLIAAGVAFYSFLALVPLMAALIGLYGFFADPADIARHLAMARNLVPVPAFELIEAQVLAITGPGGQATGTTSVVSILLATWMAKAGVNALMSGLNVAYREVEDRGLIEGLIISWFLTGLLILLMLVALFAVAVAPVFLAALPLGVVNEWIAQLVRWGAALGAIVVAIGVLYRLGAARRGPAVSWLSWGAVAATVVWAIASAGLSIYISRLGNFEATYGALGAVAALLLWFWINALAILFGAKLNAEMEHQTASDTTTGRDRPMGQRGAFVADHVARAR